MSLYQATLYGGPFDGDTSRIELPLPVMLYVVPCPKCGTHWYAERQSGGEAYEQEDQNDEAKTVKYVWKDLKTGSDDEEWIELGRTRDGGRVLTKPAPKERELVPA